MVDLDSDPTKLIEVVEIGKQLLITRGSLTTFSIANDVAKYFAIIPAMFVGVVPPARHPQHHGAGLAPLGHPLRGHLQRPDHRGPDPARPPRACGSGPWGRRRSCAATCSSTASAAWSPPSWGSRPSTSSSPRSESHEHHPGPAPARPAGRPRPHRPHRGPLPAGRHRRRPAGASRTRPTAPWSSGTARWSARRSSASPSPHRSTSTAGPRRPATAASGTAGAEPDDLAQVASGSSNLGPTNPDLLAAVDRARPWPTGRPTASPPTPRYRSTR